MREPPVDVTYSDEQIIEAGIASVQAAIHTVYENLAADREGALTKYWNERQRKRLLTIDLNAQQIGEDVLKKQLANAPPTIRGEESSLVSVGEVDVAALLDMVDGTDLLERNLGNWCSALVLYRTRKPARIITAVIGLPNKEIFYTRANQTFVRLPGTAKEQKVSMTPKTTALRDASMAFYGQKCGNLCAIVRKTAFWKRLQDLAEESKKAKEEEKEETAPRFRIYNLAGNPMMLALVDGKIDVIFETQGQRCHDVVPGFIIALKAGAYLKNLDTERTLTEADIANALCTPKEKFRYVMACNEELANEMVRLLNSKNGTVVEFKETPH